MKIIIAKTPAPGWVGGFSTSNPKFAYDPNPDLSPLPMLCNMDNIRLLDRQLDVLWPQFSWETRPGHPDSRCFQMFAPDISRAGYTNAGRIYSIICPQQGAYSPTLGDLNVEVTVTGQRGWVDETVTDRDHDLLAADMTVSAQIWFGPSAKDQFWYNILEAVMAQRQLPFPLDKANAIQLNLHHVGDPDQPTLSVRSGISDAFVSPPFARHDEVAWAVANVAVEIGPILPSGKEMVDEFNAMILYIFNLATGNMLAKGNVLTWNVWVDAPTPVDRVEWKAHAEKWRHSIDTGHGRKGLPPRYADGTYFNPAEGLIEQELEAIWTWLKKHFPELTALAASAPADRPGSGPEVQATIAG
ncbi:MAG TPA: hypothetical protein VGB04_03540 [Allosphingosinicella sp.]|jgi:hypothetical protein